MGQPLRNSQARPAAYYQTLSDRMAAGRAVKLLNEVLKKDSPVIPMQKVQVAMFYLNKLLPNYQAIAVQVEHKVEATWEEILNKAQALGMSEADLLCTSAKKPSITQGKTDSPAN